MIISGLNAVALNAIIKTNEVVHKFLLAGDKFMPEMHLKQPAFTYSACGPFTKTKEIIQKFADTGDTIDKLNDIVNECNNAYHRTIKMKPVNVKDNTYVYSMELSCSNDKDPKFKVADNVRISRLQCQSRIRKQNSRC